MQNFDPSTHRVGFACKIQKSPGVADPKCSTKGTTLTWLNNQPKQVAVDKLWTLMQANIAALSAQIDYIAALPPKLRMFRISSDILTGYSHDNWMWFYFQNDVVHFLETNLAQIGAKARANNIRLSFHPAQFCVLASENPGVVDNSIVEFEYHCDLIRYMGFGQSFQDFKCNVHIGGKLGPAGIRSALKKLSLEARNCLTIENAEFSWGLDASLELVEDCALVLDIHHHWIASGEYISPDDSRVLKLQSSWRGIRPVIHYSVSKHELLLDHDLNTKPDLAALKQSGLTSAKLRAHSDLYWNNSVNEWAASFSSKFDIMCESKEKNLASFQFAELVV